MPNTYYVSVADGNDTYDGTQQTHTTGTTGPWQTLAKVNAVNFAAGDSVLFKKSETWTGVSYLGALAPATSGSAGSPITFGSYGVTGAKPILTMRGAVPGWGTAGNWTDYGATVTNTWYIDRTNGWNISNGACRVFLNNTEYHAAQTAAGVNSTARWYSGDIGGTQRLLVYATSNPASFYSLVETGDPEYGPSTITITGKTYLTFDGLDVQGGTSAIMLAAGSSAPCSHITIQNCTLGKYSWSGIYSFQHSGSSTANDHITITGNIIASGFVYTGYTWQYNKLVEGIYFDGGDTCTITNNTVSDWCHTGIGLYGSTTAICNTNTVTGNIVTGVNTAYMRGFSMFGPTTKCQNNIVTGNSFHDLTARIQLGGNNNTFAYNLIYNITNSTATGSEGYGQGLEITTVGSTTVACASNLISNNVIYNTNEAGIRVRPTTAGTTISGNIVKNNILLTNGTSSLDGYSNVSLVIDDHAANGANTYQYNSIYSAASSNTIKYRDIVASTVALLDAGWPAVTGWNTSGNWTNLAGATVYFGAQTLTGIDSAGVNDQAWGNKATTFTCPGSGTQTLVELSAYCHVSSTTGSVRIAIYNAADDSLVAQGAAATTISNTGFGWVGHLTQASITPNPATLTGGNNYKMYVATKANAKATINSVTSGNAGTVYSDYAGGFPSTLPGQTSASYQISVRAGVPGSSNLWTFSYANNPRKVFLDGTEYPIAASQGAVDATNRWFWSAGTLTVYATSNPATFYSTITVAPLLASEVTGNNLASDPLVVSASDFRLQSTSPCRNAGVSVSLSTDFAGNAVANPPDIGAYEYLAAPTLAATTAASAITLTTASSGGNVTDGGDATVTARGVCWNTSANPTTANSKTSNGTGTGAFTSSLTGLSPATLYYVRAYATNSAGTAYGAQVTFTTSSPVGGGSLFMGLGLGLS